MVIENGSIVSSYIRDDADPNETLQTNSVTKSWMSLLIGILVEDGLLSLDTTLGEIFTDDEEWSDVTDGSTDFRKGVTIEELLTMTSGFVGPTFEWAMGKISQEERDSRIGRERSSLQGSLSSPGIDTDMKGKWSYLAESNIPSYIILKLTGMTPRQYLDKQVMRKLGIGEDEYDWMQNDSGEVESAFFGLYLTPMQMAKFGQLYLQGGRTNPSNDERVISQEWIDTSFTQHTTTDYSSFPVMNDWTKRMDGLPYGYLFMGTYERPSGSTVYCADGNGGQYICVDRDSGRVVIQQTEAQSVSIDEFVAVDVVFENSLSFQAPNDGLSGISSTVESTE